MFMNASPISKLLLLTAWTSAYLLIAAITAFPAAAQTTNTFTEWTTSSSSSQPLHVISAGPTQIYFTESARNRIGSLNTATNTVNEWLLPPGGIPHGLVLDSNSNLVFCAVGGDYLGILNPSTNQLTEYPMPTAGGGSIHLDTTVSGAGTPIYFLSESTGNKIAMVDPSSPTQVTEWTVPTAASNPRGVSIGPADGPGWQVYFVELNAHKIGMLDTFTNQITEWLLLHVRQAEHIHYVPNSNGVGGLVYFGDLADSYVGVLDPDSTSNTETLWSAPTNLAGVADVLVEQGTYPQIYFSERTASQIGFLDTSQNPGTVYSITNVVTNAVTLTQTAVTPEIYDLTKAAITAVVIPVVTNVLGTTTNGFTEWPIPTPNSGPLGIAGLGTTSVIFAEYNTGKVAIMAPSSPVGRPKVSASK
jgi:streptogramin lyase